MRIAVLTFGRFWVCDLARELDSLGHDVAFYSLVPSWRTRKFGLPNRCNRWLAPLAFFEDLKHLGGAVEPLSTPIDVINQMSRMGGHHLFAWDFHAISAVLKNIGFHDLTRWNSGASSCPELCLDDPAHAFETLYFECCK
jgi:hypothetical protein